MSEVVAKVYVDGSNIFYTQKKLGWSVDWVKMKEYAMSGRTILEWRYYVGLKDDDEKMQGYVRYLNAIGFTTAPKPLKKIKITQGETHAPHALQSGFVYKANVDVEITTDIFLDRSQTNEIILMSGDSDFAYLVKRLKDAGKRVTVFSSKKTISWELKLSASRVWYFEDLKSKIARDQ